MSTNRIPGPGSPEHKPPSAQQSQVDKKKQVEKVTGVDPDEQAKNQQFKKLMEEEAQAKASPTRGPTPVETGFYKDDTKSVFSADKALPTPGSTPPPKVTDPVKNQESKDTDLPKAYRFWEDVGLPDEKIGPPKFQQDEKATPTGRYWEQETDATSGKGKHLSPQEEKEARGMGSARGKRQEEAWTDRSEVSSQQYSRRFEEGVTERKEEIRERVNQIQPTEAAETSKQRKKDAAKRNVEIVAPSTPALPPDIQPYAIAAATQAAPYLSPEVVPLFYQMAGSIFIMTSPPGISQTEVVLNAPAFANSKYFGAKIEITKYSTAPDSLNIRLTGSNEAVTSFQKNIPSLLAAFQSGRFTFQIGRIEAHYSTEKPVFHRKGGKGGESGSGSREGGTR